MRRTTYLSITTLGAMICLIGGTGLFAALTDSARTGPSTLETAPLAGTADIQLASAIWHPGSPIACGEFGEDLTTTVFTADGIEPGYTANAFFCIRNVGSEAVLLSAMVEELSDVDVACTGDEELHGDTTCGGGQAGELAPLISAQYSSASCLTGQITPRGSHDLQAGVSTPQALFVLGTGSTACVAASIVYSTPEPQQAQSDRVTWRFKFVAQQP